MNGKVNNVQFGYGFIEGDDKQKYFAHATEMPVDELGRRYLLPGEAVTFQPLIRCGNLQACGINLVTLRAPFVGHYEEEGTVRNVAADGAYCFVLRPFGGVAMLHHRRVRECNFRDTWTNQPVFEPGQSWAFEIVRPADIARPWLAHNARQL